jgi:hypothetical protein
MTALFLVVGSVTTYVIVCVIRSKILVLLVCDQGVLCSLVWFPYVCLVILLYNRNRESEYRDLHLPTQ